MYQCQFPGFYILLQLHNMSPLGEVRGTDFANSWEFITISKENGTKIFNEKNERRKPSLPKTFIHITQGGSL